VRRIFLQVGALNYGGASVGIVQTEVQEKRAWVSKEQFLEGLALVNTFTLMLTVLPMLERLKRLPWMQAALQGISPAVIGMTAVAVLRMLPAAIPDLLSGVVAVGTVVAMELWHLGPLPLITGGAAIGFLFRARLL
jgi:chromate transporter